MHHVIIAGFGPIGRVVADALIQSDVPVTIIEMNSSTVRRQKALGRSIVQGDVTDADVLEVAGIRDAAAIVITFPDASTVLQTCRLARTLAPTAVIAIRARHLSEALQAKQLGADITVVEEIETAKAMAAAVSSALTSPNVIAIEGADHSVFIESDRPAVGIAMAP